MTVELVVMNRKAAAVAADSAVTVSLAGGQTKIFNTTSKIFALSKRLPVAALIYDGLNINGVPWETVLKEFRNAHGDVEDATVSELAARLRTFLAEESLLKTGEEIYVRAEIHAELRRLLEAAGVVGRVTAPVDGDGLEAAVADREAYWQAAPAVLGGSATQEIVAKHGAAIADEVRDAFGGHDPPAVLVQRIMGMLVETLVRWPDDHNVASHTGLVVCGFGRDDVFPALQSWRIGGVACGGLRATSDIDVQITNFAPAHVEAFAQPGDVRAFLTGVQPRIRALVERELELFLPNYAKAIVDAAGGALTPADRNRLAQHFSRGTLASKFVEQVDRFSEEEFQRPIFEMTAALPKDELALMAEALVNLTSLRKRVTAEADTVGGPVDVALITRGDGLVWIKRKAYFEERLNPHAADRYYP